MENTKANILQKINGYIVNCTLSGINNEVEKLLTIVSDYEASQELATLFIKNYTLYKADALAAILEIMIHGHKRLALVNGALNPLFRLAIFKGSVDLYECYMEEAIYPFLEDKCEEDKNEYYNKLLCEATTLTNLCFENYKIVRKGIHLNGAMPSDRGGFVLMAEENYEVMNNLYEHFNAIIGRRDILKHLDTLQCN